MARIRKLWCVGLVSAVAIALCVPAGSAAAVPEKKAPPGPVKVKLSEYVFSPVGERIAVVGKALVFVAPGDGSVFRISPTAKKAASIGSVGAMTYAPGFADLDGTPWILVPATAPADRMAKLVSVDVKRNTLGTPVTVSAQFGDEYIAGSHGKLWFAESVDLPGDCGELRGAINCIAQSAGTVASLAPGAAQSATGLDLGFEVTGLPQDPTFFELYGDRTSLWAIKGLPTSQLIQIDPATGKALGTIPFPDGFAAQVVGPDGLWGWLGPTDTEAVGVVDRRTRVLRSFPVDVNGSPDPKLAVSGKWVFVANDDATGLVQQYAAATGKLAGCYTGFPYADTLAAGAGQIWSIAPVRMVLRTPILKKPPACERSEGGG